VTLATKGWSAALKMTPLGWVSLGIAALITVGTLLIKNWEQIKLTGMNVWNTIVGAAEWAVNKYIEIENSILRGFKFAFDSIKYFGISIWNDIVSEAEKGVSALLTPLNSVLGAIGRKTIEVNFSRAKFEAVKPVWDTDLNVIPKVSFAGAKFSDDAIMAQMQRAKKEQDAKRAKSEDSLIKALEANTAAIGNNTGALDDNTVATNNNTARLRDDLSPMDLADSLLARIERHLWAT
jgi:hypothetical protein